MSIASEIIRINNNIANAYTQCSNKGATMPATQNSANLANTISTISGGGGADLDNYFNRTIDSVSTSSSSFAAKVLKKIPTLTIASGITSLDYAFYNFGQNNLNLSFDGIDCSSITTMKYTFASQSSGNRILQSVDCSSITNTSNVNDVDSLFNYNINLETITNIFSLSGQVRLRSAFENCQKLKTLDLSNWKITSLPSSNGAPSMFRYTYKLAVLDISGFEIPSGYTGWGSPPNFFTSCGSQCLQSDGAYADGIPYVYVKDANAQNWVLHLSSVPNTWTTSNVVIKS